MAVIITNGPTKLSAANGFYKVEQSSIGTNSVTGLAASTPRVMNIAFVSASAHCLGVVLAMQPSSFTSSVSPAASTHKDISVDLQEVGPSVTAATDDYITHTGHTFVNGERVSITSASMPGGLTSSQIYFVVQQTTNKYKLSLTSGGAVIDITSTGSSLVLWITRAYKQHTAIEIYNNVSNCKGAAWITPFTFIAGYAIDNTAAKWRFVAREVSTGQANGSTFGTVDGTNIMYAVWTDAQTSFTDATAATVTLTWTSTNVSSGDTITLDGKTYTFRTQIGGTPVFAIVDRDVLIGATSSESIDNLKAAINFSGTNGVNYTCSVRHPSVEATTKDEGAKTLILSTRRSHYGFNNIACAEVSTQLSLSGTLLSGATRGDQIIAKDLLTIDRDASLGGTLSGTQTEVSTALLICKSNDPTPAHVALVEWENIVSTVTISIANPGLVTWAAHDLSANDPIYFTSTGTLPTGIVAETVYYVKAVDAGSFNFSATPGGDDIETTGSQSGVHTCRKYGSYTLTIDGVVTMSAHMGFRVGTAEYPITYKNRAYIHFPERTYGSASCMGFRYYGPVWNYGGKSSIFFYGEVPSFERTTLSYDVVQSVYAVTAVAATDILTQGGGYVHQMLDGAPVQFVAYGGTLPDGISPGTTYWVRKIGTTTFYIFDTYEHAIGEGDIGRIDITSTGTGSMFIKSVIYTEDETGWEVGDILCVGGYSLKNSSNSGLHSIFSINGHEITVIPNITGARRVAGHPVVNLSRYGILLMGSKNSASMPSLSINAPSNLVFNGMAIDSTAAICQGSAAGIASGAFDDAANRSKHYITHCGVNSVNLASGMNLISYIEAPPEGIEISYNNTGRLCSLINGTGYVNVTRTWKSGEVLITDNAQIALSTYAFALGSATNSLFTAKFRRNIIETSYGTASSFPAMLLNGNIHELIDNKFFTFISASGIGALMLGTTTRLTGSGNSFDNCGLSISFQGAIQSKITMEGNKYGQETDLLGNTLPNTLDFEAAEGAAFDYTETNCIGSPIISTANMDVSSAGSILKLRNYNETAGDHRTWYQTGYYQTSSGKILGKTFQSILTHYTDYTFLSGEISGVKCGAAVGCKVENAAYYADVHTVPKLTATYGAQAAVIASATDDTTDQQSLLAIFNPLSDNLNLVLRLSQKTDAAEADSGVTWSSLAVYLRLYGKAFESIEKTITETINYVFGELVTLEDNLFITEADVSVVDDYAGITINHSTGTCTITNAHTIQELYDYSQYDMTLDANMGTPEWLTTLDGTTFISTYDIIVDGVALTGSGKTLNLGTNTFTESNGGSTNMRVIDVSGTTANVILAFTGLQEDSEVRIYEHGTQTEIAGIEESETAYNYNYKWHGSDIEVDIAIVSLGYIDIWLSGIILGQNGYTMVVQQQRDRQYLNP